MNNYLKTATILYVEDEQDVREGYSRALQRYSKELFVATNGEEALALYDKCNPDIIITDIKMPKMDGLTFIKKIKELNPSQIVLITSAHSDSEYFIEAISLQVDGYLLKPVDKNILKERVQHFSKQIILDKELEKKNILLMQKDKLASMGEMITNIAHHWRQPLSVISTAASGMQVDKEIDNLSDEKFDNYLEVIMDNTQKLSNTIEEFRFFMDVDEEFKEFNISSIIQRVLSMESHAFSNHKVEIVLNIDESISIRNLSNHLAQAIIHIVSNGVDILEEKVLEDSRYLFIDLYKENEEIKLNIKDNAGGICEDILPRIFEAYVTSKHQYVGTGLGLYTTYNIIVNDMKGSIKASNISYEYNGKQYTGANFEMTLKSVE